MSGVFSWKTDSHAPATPQVVRFAVVVAARLLEANRGATLGSPEQGLAGRGGVVQPIRRGPRSPGRHLRRQ
eukprot:5072456-Lingulodinium_polyedra.AAC.1